MLLYGTGKSFKTCLESRQGTGPKAEKGDNRRSNRARQNNKTADRKMESNDSPEIPDRGEISENPGLTSGFAVGCNHQ